MDRDLLADDVGAAAGHLKLPQKIEVIQATFDHCVASKDMI